MSTQALSEDSVRKIVELALREFASSDVEIQTNSLQQEALQIDADIENVEAMHVKLLQIIDAYLPEGEDGEVIRQIMEEWVNLGRQAKLGEMILRRDSLWRLTEQQVSDFSKSDSLLDFASDWSSLIAQRDRRNNIGTPIIVEPLPAAVIEELPPATKPFWGKGPNLTDHHASGAIAGFVMSLLVCLITLSVLLVR